MSYVGIASLKVPSFRLEENFFAGLRILTYSMIYVEIILTKQSYNVLLQIMVRCYFSIFVIPIQERLK